MKRQMSMIVRNASAFVLKHKPEFLMGFGGAFFVGAVGFAIPATVAATRLVDEAKREKKVDKLSKKEVIRLTWKCYIPTAASVALGTACLTGASIKNARRATAMMTACAISDNALREYQEKVVETIGESKEHLVRDAIAKEKIEQIPLATSPVYPTGRGNTVFLDTYSKRYFEFDVGEVRTVSQNLTDKLRDEMFLTLNDVYDEFGLEQTDLGDMVGWDVDKVRKIDIYTSAHKAPDGRPILVISYNYPPEYDYRRY